MRLHFNLLAYVVAAAGAAGALAAPRDALSLTERLEVREACLLRPASCLS